MTSVNESVPGIRKTWTQDVGALRVERAQSQGPLAHPVQVPVARRTSIIIQLKPFRLHRLWRSRALVYEGAHKPGGVSVTNMEEEWTCHHLSAFDNFRLHVDHDQLAEIAARGGAGRDFLLRNPAGAVDRTLLSLVSTLSPSLDYENNLNRLYIGHITSAMMTHIVSVYGSGLRRGRYAPALSPRHVRLAIEYMRHRIAENISVEDIASACGISAGHFTKAFAGSTGFTPHQWVLHKRIELAKALLHKGADIVSIAGICGFSDQSHFSRAFKKMTGLPPAKWRRQ
jgi:AraC family transcriptional regulator